MVEGLRFGFAVQAAGPMRARIQRLSVLCGLQLPTQLVTIAAWFITSFHWKLFCKTKNSRDATPKKRLENHWKYASTAG